jgi:hypothetical protein
MVLTRDELIDVLTCRECKSGAVYQIEPAVGKAHFKHGFRV